MLRPSDTLRGWRRAAPLALAACGLLAGAASAQKHQSRPTRTLQLTVPGSEDVVVRSGLSYRPGDESSCARFDLYYPSEFDAEQDAELPLVVFMNGGGYGNFTEWTVNTSWARATAASGMAAVVFNGRANEVEADIEQLMRTLKQRSAELGVDAKNMAWWVCGANVNKVLPLAMVPSRTALRTLVVYYGMPSEWPEPRADLGLFVVKAGRDWHDQNALIDRFVIDALRLERDLTLMVHPTAHAAFDVSDSSDRTRFILRHTLEYLKMQLSPQMRVEAELAVLERRAKAAFEEAMKSESKGHGPIDQTAWHRTADLYGQILEARPEFGEGWFRVGWAHLRLGSFDDAVVAFQSAADHGYWVAASTYNVACAAARNGELDRALAALQKALELGFEDSALLRGDPDLDNVRGDPRFQDLLNSWGIRGRRDEAQKKHAFQVTDADEALRN